MRHLLNKSWPYPVLRGYQQDPDYPRAEFEVTCEPPSTVDDDGSFTLDVEFALSHRGMKGMIQEGKAQYCLLVKSPRTFYRRCLTTDSITLSHRFKGGELADKVELTGFVLASEGNPRFSLDGWHQEYLVDSFDIYAGAVLALDQLEPMWIDSSVGGPLRSIFDLKRRDDLEPGVWSCSLEDDRVQLELESDTYERIERCMAYAEHDDAEASRLMNGVYLPALVSVIECADADAEARGGPSDLEGLRWHEALQMHLASAGLRPIGEGWDRAQDAQALLEFPLAGLLNTSAAL